MAKPLVIFVAEAEHSDLSYASLVEKITKDCDEKGLNIKVFSEFGNKEQGLGSEDEKAKKAGYFSEDKINQFVNQRCEPIGSVFDRFVKLIPEVKKSLPIDATPEQIFDQLKGNIDNPETLKFLEAEIALRKKNQEEGKGGNGDGNSRGIDGEDCKNFLNNLNAFVQKPTHQRMAEDAKEKIDRNEDVVIIIAGAPHIYGLNEELKKQSIFLESEKIVVGNFQDFTLDPSNMQSIEKAKHLGGKESCEKVGEFTSFEAKDNVAKIPEKISKSLQKALQKPSTLVEPSRVNRASNNTSAGRN